MVCFYASCATIVTAWVCLIASAFAVDSTPKLQWGFTRRFIGWLRLWAKARAGARALDWLRFQLWHRLRLWLWLWL